MDTQYTLKESIQDKDGSVIDFDADMQRYQNAQADIEDIKQKWAGIYAELPDKVPAEIVKILQSRVNVTLESDNVGTP